MVSTIKNTEDRSINENGIACIGKSQTLHGIPMSPPKKDAKSPLESFEEKLTEMRLQNTLKLRKQLENKLKGLDMEVDLLSAQKSLNLTNSVSIKKPKEHSWLTTEARQKWQDEWNKKAQEAEEFTKKVNAVQKQIKLREKEKQNLLSQKEKEELEEKKKLEEEAKQLQLMQKEEERKKKEEEKEEKRKQRELLLSLAATKPPKREYMHEKLQQRYHSEVEMPELEKRKQEIAEKRNLYKPIRMSDIEQHKRKHEEILMKLEEERKAEREKKLQENPNYMEKMKEMQTVFTEEFIKKRLEEKEKNENLLKKQQEKQEKRLSYAKLIKETFEPKKDEKKAKELEEKIKNLKHPVRHPPPAAPRLTPKAKERLLAKVPKEKLKGGKSERRNRSVDHKDAEPIKTSEITKKGNKVSMGVQAEKAIQEIKKIEEKKKIDYLQEIKKLIPKREIPLTNNFDALVKNTQLSPSEKFKKVQNQLELLEETVRKKENRIVKGKASDNLQLGNEVSDMYINAIKAKISLLGL